MSLAPAFDNAHNSANAFAICAKMNPASYAEHLSVFVDVVREGSFSAAGRRRGVSPSSVVRQIDALEQDLDVKLLIRSTRALALTDAGTRLFERAKQILDDLSDTRAEVAAVEGRIAGVLRIACFPTFGKRYVLPVLAGLMAKHPDLRAELDLTEKLADPVADRLDAVIRIGQLSDCSLIATRLCAQLRLLVASPAYITKAQAIETVADLQNQRLIDKVNRGDRLGWIDILGRPVERLADDRDVFRCDDFEAMRQAALQSIGVALLPDWVVGSDVRDGSLVRLRLGSTSVEPWNEADVPINLLRALPHASAKLSAFTSALRAHIGSPPIWHD